VGGYSQAWLRGEEPSAHVHEGVRLDGGDGWVGVGQTLEETWRQIMVRLVDNEGKILWTFLSGAAHNTSGQTSYSVGFSIAQGAGVLYIGTGVWDSKNNMMKPAVLALEVTTGVELWRTVMDGHPGNGGVRGVIVDESRIICTGYVNNADPGFLFVVDAATPVVWELDTAGNLVKENLLAIEGVGQGAKIRKDKTSGYVMTTTAWNGTEGVESNYVAVIKLSASLEVEWSQLYGLVGGNSQVFDMLVDRDGNYLMGGHTDVGPGVVNWDYLALKVNSNTRQVEWRKTFGQPRGFDPRFIHDEMYGVALDPAGNYLLLGGSGDEYEYSATNSTTDWDSDTWVSYLVVLDTQGHTLYEGVYGDKGGNNAGEYLSVDIDTGDIMVFTDSDTVGGFGFLKLTPF